MKRKTAEYTLHNPGEFEIKLVHWLSKQRYFSLFNGNHFNYPFGPFAKFAAAGAIDKISGVVNDPFKELVKFYRNNQDWLVGRLNYDLKNHIEKLESRHEDPIESPEIAFFVPETLIFFDNERVKIQSQKSPDLILNDIREERIEQLTTVSVDFTCDTLKEEYLKNIDRIKNQIKDGDFYELNYCMGYHAVDARIEPALVYLNLNNISPMPFSVFQGFEDHLIISASPERFLKKEGRKLIAQPIKGTIRRDTDPAVDEKLKKELKNSEKEIAENMMIVDLTRNDLSRSAVPGSVKVDGLFEVFTFSHLHQMISTVSCTLAKNINPFEAIKNAFPMGSMTGAPKIRVMQEIEKYEKSKRGMFSGAAGYVSPTMDFDFNVLIRSLFYNRKQNTLKYHVGSAITYDADPESEYRECLLKARAIIESLGLAYDQ